MSIILASKSPRRKELLKELVPDFLIDVPVSPEVTPRFTRLVNVPKCLATHKANEVFIKHQDSLIIAADTIVIAKHQILGKPKDYDDACRMLHLLSDRTHLVVTGVCLKSKEYEKKFKCISKVTFRKMSDEEIKEYCKLETIYDKAGAYAIQGEAKEYITKLKGSYSNVVGLPLEKLKLYLK